jgi:hypothetical protein
MGNKSALFSIIFFHSLFLFFVSCSVQEAQWMGSIEEADGIIVVRNPSEPMYDENVFILEEDLSIESRGREDEFVFQYTPNLVVDNEENIYVLDTLAAQIIVFDKYGDLLRKFGKKGQGPGEMGHPLDIQIYKDKELMVSDLTQQRLDFYSLEGEFLRDISTHDMPHFRRPVVDSAGNIIAGFWNYGDEFRYELKKFNGNLDPVNSIASQRTVTQPGIQGAFEMQRATNLVWDVTANDDILWGMFTKYEIFVLNSSGTLVKQIVKDHEGRRIGKEEIDELLGGQTAPSYLKFPERFPSFIRFTCDEKGRIFIQTYEKSEEEDADYYDVFDAEGKYIVRVALKYRPLVWKNNRLYTFEEDEEGYQVVKRYKVTWNI